MLVLKKLRNLLKIMKSFKTYITEAKDRWIDADGQVVYEYGSRNKEYLPRAEFIEVKDLLGGTITTKAGKVFHPPFKKVVDETQTSYIGYKIVGWDGQRAFSIYNKAFTITINKGAIIADPKGIHLGVSKKYVLGYFSAEPEKELLLTYEYKSSDLIAGDPDFQMGEVMVKQARLIEIEKMDESIYEKFL